MDPSLDEHDSELAQLAVYMERILDEVDELKAVNAALRAELDDAAAPTVPKPEARPVVADTSDVATDRDSWREERTVVRPVILRGPEPVPVTQIIGETQRHGGTSPSGRGDRFDVRPPGR